jgi:uncharacterized protein YigE (DUF2233 family)
MIPQVIFRKTTGFASRVSLNPRHLALQKGLSCIALLACALFASKAARAMSCRRIAYRGASYALCEIDLKKDDLRLFWKNPANGRPFGSFDELKAWGQRSRETLVFATNSGIFGRDRTPLGLHVQDGAEKVKLNLRSGGGNFFMKPGCVFFIRGDAARIVESSKYRKSASVRLAAQSGPALVLNGRIHPLFREGSASLYIRSGVGVVSPHRVVFALSEQPVNFHAFATLFKERLGCRNALYLDGSISKFYCPALGLADGSGNFAGMFGVLVPARSTKRR